MKSAEIIDRIEKTLPQKLRRCRYCGENAREYVRADRNFRGEEGFICTVRCPDCGSSVFAFGYDERAARIMARSYWERGICDA